MPSQAQVEKMVNMHVLVSATEMINNLAANEQYMYELDDILSQPDYENPAYDAGFRVKDCVDGYYVASIYDDEREDGPYRYKAEAWQNACEDNGIEPQTNDAMEWYIVTEWMGNKLEQHGEMVNRDFMGFTIWGRSCSGQPIYMDGVMVDIWNGFDE